MSDQREATHPAIELQGASRRKFYRTLTGVMLVQAIALGLLWLLQIVYGV